MQKSVAADSPSSFAVIAGRIAELADWRGEALRRMRGLIREAGPDVMEEWSRTPRMTGSHSTGRVRRIRVPRALLWCCVSVAACASSGAAPVRVPVEAHREQSAGSAIAWRQVVDSGTNEVRGRALDSETLTPIAALAVLVDRDSAGSWVRIRFVAASGDGRFTVKVPGPGEYRLRMRRIGYVDAAAVVTVRGIGSVVATGFLAAEQTRDMGDAFPAAASAPP